MTRDIIALRVTRAHEHVVLRVRVRREEPVERRPLEHRVNSRPESFVMHGEMRRRRERRGWRDQRRAACSSRLGRLRRLPRP